MSEHTPGPWHVCANSDDGRTVIRDATGFAICSEWHFLSRPSVANAHLIAAAPDLLAACKSMSACCGPASGWDGETNRCLLLIEAAIAKAETQ